LVTPATSREVAQRRAGGARSRNIGPMGSAPAALPGSLGGIAAIEGEVGLVQLADGVAVIDEHLPPRLHVRLGLHLRKAPIDLNACCTISAAKSNTGAACLGVSPAAPPPAHMIGV
jgi:hypothetical protein